MLLDFEWERDEAGYDLVDGVSPRRIVRRHGRLVNSRPLEKTDDLVQLFILAAKTEEGLLDFYTRFGPLTKQGHSRSGEEASYGMWLAKSMDDLLNASPQERLDILRSSPSSYWSLLRPTRRWEGINCAITEIKLVADPVTGTPRLKFFVKTLEEALLLQFAQSIAGERDMRTCTYCGVWFDAGPGTGRRADAKFCSDEHRIAFNSQKRTKRE